MEAFEALMHFLTAAWLLTILGALAYYYHDENKDKQSAKAKAK